MSQVLHVAKRWLCSFIISSNVKNLPGMSKKSLSDQHLSIARSSRFYTQSHCDHFPITEYW